MANQTLLQMKQPRLGKRISELRKAKGWTQEELVEKCNLNVRTIQRIEAGEVTPRSYTVKALFEALGVQWKEEGQQGPAELSPATGENRTWILMGFIAGIVYFIVSFFEIAMDMEIVEGIGMSTEGYIPLKVSVFLFFSLFLFGYTKIAQVIPNKTLEVGAWVLLGLNALWIIIDILAYIDIFYPLEDYIFVKLITVGLAYILFGFGFLQYKNLWSNGTTILGALAIITGVLFATVIGSLPGMFTFTLLEIGQLAFMIWAMNYSGRKSPSPVIQ